MHDYGVATIEDAVYDYFSNHFKVGNMVRHRVDDFNFKTLRVLKTGDLIKLFSNEELVRREVWDYDSFKTPRFDSTPSVLQ